jgi:hypothetical protein
MIFAGKVSHAEVGAGCSWVRERDPPATPQVELWCQVGDVMTPQRLGLRMLRGNRCRRRSLAQAALAGIRERVFADFKMYLAAYGEV